MTSYSAREPDPGSPVSNLLEANVRVRFRDRRPRDLPVRSRVGVGRKVRLVTAAGQWHPCPSSGAPKVGRIAHQPRDGRTRCADAPARATRVRSARSRRLAIPCDHAPPSRSVGLLAVAIVVLPARRVRQRERAGVVRSDRSMHGRRTRRGRLPGSRGSDPHDIPGRGRPDASTRAATAPRPTSAPSRDQGISEVRFAGGTWSFGAERAIVLAVFSAKGMTSDDIAAFYARAPHAAARTKVDRGGPSRRSPGERVGGSTRDQRAAPVRRRLAVGRPRTPSTWSSPTTCPTPGSRTPIAAFGGA